MHLSLSTLLTAVLVVALPFLFPPRRFLRPLIRHFRLRYTKKGRRARCYGSNY